MMRGIQGCPGEQYGYWTLVSKTPDRPNYWLCRCVCGKMRDVQLQSLRRGISVSCGCKKSELISQKNRLDLTGKRYGMLSVIEPETIDKYGYVLWLCKCDCRNTVLKRASLLSTGNICSCGCMKPPKRSAGAKRLDMVGRTFGYLTVLSPAPGSRRPILLALPLCLRQGKRHPRFQLDERSNQSLRMRTL